MRWCVTGKQMQMIEKKVIHEIGIPALVLMERAALAVASLVEKEADVSKRIWITCGTGNNGADGIAIARMLHQKGYLVTIITIGNPEKTTEEYKVQERIARNIGVSFISWESWDTEMVQEEDWIVDGIFGIGLTREIVGAYRLLIEKVNACVSQHKIAIDIPSGIDASTGAMLGCACKAHHTVTFGYEKVGLYLGAGRMYAGKISVVDIGLENRANGVDDCSHEAVVGCKILESIDCQQIPVRREDANKGDYGKLLIVAGSEGMSGAAYLAALAAYRTGAGLVKILTHASNLPILQAQLPEAIVQGFTEDNLSICAEEACCWATHVIMGPGLGQGDYVATLIEAVLKSVKEENVPTVLDSDALNTISKYRELERYYGDNMVITPHMKEMSRLTKEPITTLKMDGIGCARKYCAQHAITCVMKDAVSVIVKGEAIVYLNISGNSALAKGGTGDVLAGIIGGLLCLGMETEKAAAFGAYMHGRAGTRASEKKGKHGVLASDIVDFLY